MQYLKDIGFVIRRTNVSEADRYITILTLNNGKIDVLAKGVKRISSRRAGNLELLNKISFQAVAKTQSAKYVLTEVELVSSHTDLKHTLSNMRSLFAMCELLITLCPHHQKQTDAFHILENALKNMQNGTLEMLETFQVQLLTALGYWDPERVFVSTQDINNFTENIMERKIKSHEFFRAQS